MAASVTSPASIAAPSVSSRISRNGTLAWDADISSITNHGLSNGSGIRSPTPCFAAISMQMRWHSSNAITSAPLSMTRPNSDSAASGDGTATNAVSTRFNAGCNRNAAAVMIPNVPSPPMNICRSA